MQHAKSALPVTGATGRPVANSELAQVSSDGLVVTIGHDRSQEDWEVKLHKPAALGPCWVRVTTVEHGHGRSLTVAHGSEEPQVAGPSAQAAGIT